MVMEGAPELRPKQHQYLGPPGFQNPPPPNTLEFLRAVASKGLGWEGLATGGGLHGPSSP